MDTDNSSFSGIENTSSALTMGSIVYTSQIESLSVTFHGHDLIVDSELELNYGRLVKHFNFIFVQLIGGLSIYIVCLMIYLLIYF